MAVPKDVTDRRVQALKEVALKPSAVYSRADALAAAAGVQEALVVAVGSLSAAIVVVLDGVPRIVHQVDLPERGAAPHNRADMVTRAVEQVEGYYQTWVERTGVEDDRDEPLPIVLTGEIAREVSLVDELNASLDRRMTLATPALEYPGHFPVLEYSSNMGLALADRARFKSLRKLTRWGRPSINLLPERHLPRRLPVLSTAVFTALFLVLFGAFGATGLVDDLAWKRDVHASHVANLERQVRGHRLSLLRAEVMSQRALEASELAGSLEAHLTGLGRDVDVLVAQLEVAIGQSFVSQVGLSSLILKPSGFVLSGTAKTHEDILLYVSGLRGSGKFTDVRLLQLQIGGANITGQEGGAAAVTFQAEVLTGLASDVEGVAASGPPDL